MDATCRRSSAWGKRATSAEGSGTGPSMILGLVMALALGEVTALLEKLAPLDYAESWDNVGLLLEPAEDRKQPGAPPSVRRVMLLVDLTKPVLDEVLARDVDLVCAYHPPI